MFKKQNKYSKKIRFNLKNIFKKTNNLVDNLETEEINKPQINGWTLILGYMGIFFMIAGGITLLPIITMIFYPNEFSRILAFLIPGVIAIISGFFLSRLLKNKTKARLEKYQDLILLILIWLSTCLICCVPFLLPDYIKNTNFRIGGLGLNFVQSMFETVSGFTTTGLTMLTDSITPTKLLMGDGHCFLFYRSIIMLFGGIGFVLVLTCVVSDTYGMRLYYNEGHTDRLLPNLYKSAKLILSIYIGLVLLGSLALWLGGMNSWTEIKTPIGCEGEPITSSYFEALCFSMTSFSTGGFATRNLSLYSFNNVTLEIILSIIMLIGGTNFLIIFSAITLKFTKVFKDLDVKVEMIFAIIFIPILVLLSSFNPTFIGTKLTLVENLRYNVFHFISGVTTTGAMNAANIRNVFNTGTYSIMIFIMACGCQQGSTCAGIKLYRVGICAKSIYWTIKEKNLNPNTIYPHYVYKYGETKEIKDKEISDVNTYIFIYVGLLLLCAILISIVVDGYNFIDCLFEATSALSSTGLSSGIACGSQKPFILIILTILMFVGRLEIYTFIYASKRLGHDVNDLFQSKFKKIKKA